MTESPQGTIYFEWTLPTLWPPGARTVLLSNQDGESTAELVLNEDGHLLFHVSAPKFECRYHFQHLRPTSTGSVKLAVSWGPDKPATMFIGGQEVRPLENEPEPFVFEPVPLPAPRHGVFIPLNALDAMAPNERLLVETIRDIEGRLGVGTAYDLVRVSGLLRQLLIDERPLIHEANTEYRIKLRFCVAARREPFPIDLDRFAFHFHSLTPSLGGVEEVTLDTFLRLVVVEHNRQVFSVRDVVLTGAHVMGGIHNSPPKTEVEERLVQLAADMELAHSPLPHAVIRDIALVTIQAALPLLAAIVAKRNI